MRWVLFMFILLPAAFPAAVADVAGVLSAPTVEGSGGVRLEGNLAAFRAGADDGLEAAAFGELELSAGTLRVETDVEQQNASVAGTGVAPWTYQEATDYQSITASTLRVGERAQVLLLPQHAATVVYAAEEVQVDATDDEIKEARRVISDRPLLSAHGQQRVLLAPGAVHVSGSFLVILWDVDLDVVHAEGAALVSSGETRRDVVAGVVQEAQFRQVYIHAQEAELVLRIGDVSSAGLWLADAEFDARGLLRVPQASGSVAGYELNGDEVELVGASATVAPTGNRLEVTIARAPESIRVNGVAVQIAPESASFHWMWVVAGALLAALCYVALVLRRRMLLSRAASLMDARRFEGVLDTLGARRRWGRRTFQAATLRVIAFLRLGRTREAADAVSAMRPRNDHERGLAAYLRAYQLGLDDEQAAAAEHVAESLRYDPALREEILGSSLLRPLVRRVLLEGAEGYA